MTIHRLTVTVTVIETTTITISQPKESNDEEWIDLPEHIADGSGSLDVPGAEVRRVDWWIGRLVSW